MTDYPYEPPERVFQDTLLAFKDFEMASTWSVRVEADPLGPVNKLVTLMKGQRRIKSTLCPVPVGARVRCRQDWMDDPSHPYEGPLGKGFQFTRWPAWIVEVNGERVLEVRERDTHPLTPPKPAVPLWKRMRDVLREQARADVDWVAARLGYHREDHCDNYGDW